MAIGPLTSAGMSFRLLEAYRKAELAVTTSAERLSANQRINAAGDDPSGSVALAGLQKKYEDMLQRARLAGSSDAVGAYQSISAALQGVLNQATAAKTALAGGDPSKLAGVVAALRGAALSSIAGVKVFAGNPLNTEKTYVDHAVTSGSITGTTVTGAISFGSGTTDVSELVNDAQTQRLNTNLVLNSSNSRKGNVTFTLTEESTVRISNTWPGTNGNAGSTEVTNVATGTRVASSSYHGSPYNDTFNLVLGPGTYKIQANGDIFNDYTANVRVMAGTVRRAVGVELNGQAYQVVLTTGNRSSLTQAVTDLKSAIESQTTLRAGTDFTLDVVNNQVVAKSLKQGTGSTIDFSGTIADAMGLTGGPHVRGQDAYRETIIGANKPLTISFGGRSMILDNLDKSATTLQAAIDSGDTTTMQAAIGGIVTALGLDQAEASKTLGLLASDATSLSAQADLFKARIDHLQHVDVAEETGKFTAAQLQAQQAAWAIKYRIDGQAALMRKILGLD